MNALSLLKSRTFLSICLFLSFGFSLTAATLPVQPADLGGWEKLGQRKVNYKVDRDEIFVTAKDGRFTKVKIHVKHAPINMRKMVVHFGNGETQNVQLRNKIPAGGESRVIDLKGGKRVIKKVVFWYDTKNYGPKRAILELHGRH